MPRAKTIMVDLDGVLCTEELFHDRPLATPIAGAQAALRKLRAAGYVVVIYTARTWGEYRITRKWLDDHGFQYDGLHMGKPVADLWIDDRAVRFTDWDAVLQQVDRPKPAAGAKTARAPKKARR